MAKTAHVATTLTVVLAAVLAWVSAVRDTLGQFALGSIIYITIAFIAAILTIWVAKLTARN